MGIKDYKELWSNSPSQGIYCVEKHVSITNTHKDQKLGSRFLDITPEKCFECKENIINGGICDPI